MFLLPRLKKIFPGMRSEGVVLTIPMPGHPVPDADRDSFQETVARLDTLVPAKESRYRRCKLTHAHSSVCRSCVWC